MRLQELFLTETTEEDRALVSLSSSIYDYIKAYDGDGKDIDLGTIEELFDTPLPALNSIRLKLFSNETMVNNAVEVNPKADRDSIQLGSWDGMGEVISLNIDQLQSNRMKSAITHELRHALDDFKSDFKAGASNRYSTPKDKSLRNVEDDPYTAYTAYIAQPAEINARFIEVLHSLVPVIKRGAKLPKPQLRDAAIRAFKHALQVREIAELFPERTVSRDYRRLIKRGVDFIDKEIAYVAR